MLTRLLVNGEEFQVGQVVFVKNTEESECNAPDALDGWLAKVLEVRAGDSSHVYLRVFWAYRPEDLPGGRQPHHGVNEVIVSNHMDIIEALTVQSAADMVYWNDDPDSLPLPEDELFFRQSFDITKSNPLSKLNKYCIDNQPINPNELLVQCSHCSEWLHAHCLEEQAIQNLREDSEPICPLPNKRGRSDKHAKSNSNNSATKSSFDANLTVSDTGKARLTITCNDVSKEKMEMRQWDVDITCLKCGKVIENAEDGFQVAEHKDSTIHVFSHAAKDNGYENDPAPITPDSEKALIKDDGTDSVMDHQDRGQDAEMKGVPPNEAFANELEAASTTASETKGEMVKSRSSR
ncbi:hypothetical protein ACJQWK_05715 [Exserohilum turcicum]